MKALRPITDQLSLYLWLVLQEVGEGQGIAALLVDAQGECLHASLQQEAGVRVQAASQMIQA